MKFPLIPQDKANHAVYGSAIFTAVAVLAAFLGGLPLLAGLAAVTAVAIVKEIYDKVSGTGTPDPWDFVWTVGGGVPGMVLCYVFAGGFQP